MNRTALLLYALTAVLLLQAVPVSTAQTHYTRVDRCVDLCTPQQANADALKTGDQSAMTLLFAHCEDIVNRCFLNAQPTGADDPVVHSGMTMPTVVSDAPGSCGSPNVCFINNWFYWASSAGLVERGQDGVARVHPEPGLAESLKIGPAQPYLFFYMTVNPVPNSDDGTSPGNLVPLDTMPAVGIYARMETGRMPFRGKVILEGDTVASPAGPLKGPDGRDNLVSDSPGQAQTYEFKVPLNVVSDSIPSVQEEKAGFVVSINVYQIKDAAATNEKGSQVTDYQWKVRYGADTPARILLEVKNPLFTKSKSLSIFDNSLFVRWSFVSPLGSYDADDRSVKIQIDGPTAPDKALTRLVILKRMLGHNGHFFPVNATWRFDYSKAGLADGEYTVTTSILNYQGTYQLVEQQKFTVSGGQIQGVSVVGTGKGRAQAGGVGGEAPGFEGVILLAALVLSGLVASRRRE